MAETAVTIITVQGEAHARRTAERAIVSLSATVDGPDRDPVVDAVASAASAITALITADLDPTAGPIVRFSADRAHVWSDRPWNQQGEQLPLVQVINVGQRVTRVWSLLFPLLYYIWIEHCVGYLFTPTPCGPTE